MLSAPTFVLFSGHNDRAAIALCRFFDRSRLPFIIVASGSTDVIHRTAWRDRVVLNRVDRRLDVPLFHAVVQAAQSFASELVYCPTTEFMNQFILHHRAAVESAGLRIPLCTAQLYGQLTGKLSSQQIVETLTGLRPPPALLKGSWHAPCVLKPRNNVSGQEVLYPRICLTNADLDGAMAGLDLSDWFAQQWIEGQSYYLCAYLTRAGERAWFWQDNLMQQPGGKSIVLACSADNPGLDAEAFLDGLHAIGYHGPLMIELIRDSNGILHYIEINPRFWGPLQLALSACPRLLTLFARDAGAAVAEPPDPGPGPHWYAWAHGAQKPGCRLYPSAIAVGAITAEHPLLQLHDVYGTVDTAALHGCF